MPDSSLCRTRGPELYILKAELQMRIKEFHSCTSEKQSSEYAESRRRAQERREEVWFLLPGSIISNLSSACSTPCTLVYETESIRKRKVYSDSYGKIPLARIVIESTMDKELENTGKPDFSSFYDQLPKQYTE